MTRHAFSLAASLLLAASVVLLHACSGAVSGSPAVNDPTRITILPATATLYSGAPTTFTLSGGTGSYIVSSSDQSVLPINGSVNGSQITVVPNQVPSDTSVTLTVRDTGATPLATATLTVRPGTVNNDITITPSNTQGGDCSPALCSGGDAIVSARLAQNGLPLTGRQVRFDVVSGDFDFISSSTSTSTGTVETLTKSITVISDETGRATARLRAASTSSNQSAILQVTDVTSGAFQRAGFTIAQATGSSPGFFAAPSSIKFTGPLVGQCAQGGSADIFVFGGTPPYRVSNASAGFTVNRTSLSFSGDSFTISPTGACTDGLPIVITDSSGRTTTVTASNVQGTTTPPVLVVAPTSLTLSSCNSVGTLSVGGGTGNYFATAGSGEIFVSQTSSSTFSVQRTPNSSSTSSPLNVGISDGVSVVNVVVNLTGAALGQCPTPGFTATPTSVVINSCTAPATVTLSGGSGTYFAASGNSSITATVNQNTLSIARAAGAGPIPSGQTVTVSDGSNPIPINVDTGGSVAAGSCP